MPYVMPQQVKEKAGDHGTVFRESTGLDITFVRANHRCCFIEYAVDELMAVFCAERFRQFDRFVNGHFVWHIATFRQFVQRNAQYCFLPVPVLPAGGTGMASSVRRGMRY